MFRTRPSNTERIVFAYALNLFIRNLQDDSDIPDDTVLASRILEQYQCNSRTGAACFSLFARVQIIQLRAGAAFLIPRCDQATEPLRHLSDRQDICRSLLHTQFNASLNSNCQVTHASADRQKISNHPDLILLGRV